MCKSSANLEQRNKVIAAAAALQAWNIFFVFLGELSKSVETSAMVKIFWCGSRVTVDAGIPMACQEEHCT